jgi:hypothetical protein
MSKCLLFLMLFCHPAKADAGLLFANVVLTSADIHETYALKRAVGPGFGERNPLGRPFIETLPEAPSMFLADGGDVGVAELGYRMRHSSHWYRHIWWAPQVALGGANIWGTHSSATAWRPPR